MARNDYLDSLGDTATYLASMGWSDVPSRTILIADGVLKKAGKSEASKVTIRRVVATAVAAARGRAAAKARLADRRKASPKKLAARVVPPAEILGATEKPILTAESSLLNAPSVNVVEVCCSLCYLEGVAQLFEEPERAVQSDGEYEVDKHFVCDDSELSGLLSLVEKSYVRPCFPSSLCRGGSGVLALPPSTGRAFDVNFNSPRQLLDSPHPPRKLKHFVSFHRQYKPMPRANMISRQRSTLLIHILRFFRRNGKTLRRRYFRRNGIHSVWK